MIFTYDTVIIGSGIAGLYTAYKMKKKYPGRKILILEKLKKQYIGGRTNDEDFYGVEVVTGAGIGRKEKDFLLLKLLKELNVPYNDFTVQHQYASTVRNPVHVGKVIQFLKKKYKEKIKYSPLRETFKNFALPILGPELYHDFVVSTAYTDFENEDVHDTLYYYGMDDNENGWTAIHLSWKQLVERISKHLHIKTSQGVSQITRMEDGKFLLNTDEGNTYTCLQVVVATTISSVRKFFHTYPIYNYIEGQTFLRMYGKFTKTSTEIMKQYSEKPTIVDGPVHRIIPMNVEKGVYMIAYTDNEGAKYFKDNLKNTAENREFWARTVEHALGIPSENKLKLISILNLYWPIGTHYYKPLPAEYKNRKEFIKDAQNPFPGIVLVGEMVSLHQGWVEGALESVEAVFPSL
jgi:hypothetical protein